MKPWIGIITRPTHSESNHPIEVIYSAIKNTIINHGGIPIVIIPTTSKLEEYTNNNLEDNLELIQKCHGIILQGGDDFYPYDLKILEYLKKENIPVLGICLGMQTMAYLDNGILKKHQTSNHDQPNQKYVHKVMIDPNSKLYQILKKEIINVNSRHKETITHTNLDVVGKSEDGIIEAVEDKEKDFYIGVQWHPETMITYDEDMNKLFAHFIKICQERIER